MPNWKKLIVSGSDATLNSLNVTTTGSFGGDITLTSGSFRVETFTEGLQFYNGSNYTTNRITLTSAQNMQFRTGNTFQFTGGPLQILAGNQLGLKNSASDNLIRLKNTGASGQGKLEIQDNSANALMAISASGNIGIGTTTPGEKFHVRTSNNTVAKFESTDGNANIRIGDTVDNTHIGTDGGKTYIGPDTSVGGNNLTILSDGKVGIGTGTPDSLLEISSDSVTDFLKLTSEGSSANPIKLIFEKGASEQGIIEYNRNGDLEIYNSDSDGGVMIDGSTSAGGDLYVANSGNVGIGTTSVEEKLGVNGNIQLPNQQQITWSDFGDGNTGRVAIRGNEDNDTLLFRTDNQVRATLSNSGLDVNGSVTSSAQIVASGSQLRAINDAADSVGLTLESPSAGVNVNFDFEVGDTGISNLHAKNLVIRGSSGASDIAFSPSTAYPGLMMLDGSAGRVGIGTTSPLYKLHIKGSTYVNSGTLFIDSGQRLKWGNSNQFIEGTDDTSLEFGTGGSTKLIILNSGNVGINNTSPSKRLVVNGQTQFYEYSGAHLTNNAHSTYNFDTLVTNASATAGGGIGAYVKLAAGATNNSLGDFNAIRTRAYAENTTVNVGGLINFYAEYRNFTSTNSVTLSNHYGLKVDALSVGGNATVTNNYGVYLNPGTTASNNYGVFQVGSAVINRFAGKVGIGDDPDRALHVKDSSIVTTKLQGQSSAGHLIDLVHDHSNDGYNGLRFFDQTSGRMHITHIQTGTKGYIQVGNNWASGSEILVVEGDNERVGIGTKSPSAQLHATGNTLIGGYLRVQDVSSNHAIQINSSTSGNARILAHNLNLNQDHNLDIEAKEIDLQAGSTAGGTLASVLKLTSASATFAGDVNVGGKLTAQEFHTEFVSASIIYDSGSTKFGDTPDDVHDFTGSINIHSGSFTLKPLFQSTTGIFKIIHGPSSSGTIRHIKVENTGSQQLFGVNTDSNGHTSLELLQNGTQRVRMGTYWPTYINNGGYSTRGGLLVGTGSYTDNYYGLAVAEGGSSGSLNVADTLYVSGSRVGVKTTAPEDELEVFGDFRIRNSNGSNPADAGNLFFAETNGVFGSDAYGFRIHQDGSNNRLHFQGGAAASTVDNILVLERDSGDVGINTANPDEKLVVDGNIKISADRFYMMGGGNFKIGVDGGSVGMHFHSGGSEKMTLLAGGKLGIGTTTPDAKLDVVLGADTSSIARFTGGSNSRELTISSFSVNSLDGAGFKLNATSTSGSIVLQTTTVDRLTVDRDGVVTIGALTSGQTGQLVVNTEGGVPPVAKFMSRTNKAIVQVSDNDTTGFISSENGLFSIGRNGGVNANNININASNKVGIGTSNPGRVLHLYHATENEVLRLESGDGGAYVQFKDNNSDFQPAVGAVGNNLQFRASGSQIAKFDIDGNLRLGSDAGTVRARLHLSGSTAAACGIRQSRSGSKIWAQEIDSNGKLEWKVRATEGGTATKGLVINDTGQIIFPQYGSGNYTGTAAKTLAVDSSGNIIETDGGGSGTVDGSGSGSRVAIWSDADSITSDSGFTFDGTELLVEDTIVIQRAGVTAGSSSFQQTGTGLILNAPSGYHPLVIKHAGSELFRFRNNGRLGIGTTTPDHQLHVEFLNTDTSFSGGSGGAWGSEGIRIENTSPTPNTMAMLHLRNNDADIHIAGIRQGTDDSDLGFFFEGTERVRITNSGAVGIGTNNPSRILHVRGASSNEIFLAEDTNSTLGTKIGRFKQTDGTNNPYLDISSTSTGMLLNTGFNTGIPGSFVLQSNGGSSYLALNTNGANERMRITSAGNVGIGTNSPDVKLHVESEDETVARFERTTGSGFTAIDIRDGIGTTGNSAIRFSDTGGSPGEINYEHADNSLRINTNGDEKLRIKADGKVGIGTTGPNFTLDVQGTGNEAIFVSGSTARLQVKGGGTNSNNLNIYSWNSAVNIFNNSSTTPEVYFGRDATADNIFYFRDNSGFDLMKVDTAVNRVGIGTTSMETKLHISSSTFNDHITLGRDSDELGITVSGGQLLLEGGVTPFSNDASDLGRSDKHWRNLYITDNIYVSASGDLNLTGSLKISSNLTVANNTTTNLLYTDNIQTRNGTVIDFRHQDASVIMRVDTDDAKVGIGSTSTGAPSPTYKLDVQGSSSNTNIRVLTTTGNAGVRVNTNNSHYVLTGVGSTNQFTIYDSNATEVRFAINSTGKVRFNSYGSATHTGTPAKTLQVDSNGNIIEGAIVNFAPKVEYQALSSDIAANATFTLPNSLSYTVSSGGYEYLEIFLDGIRLMRGIDFEEISTTQVKILMAVPSGSVFTYKSIT